jgi:DNA-binding YbaB/EbfC family protein
MTMNMGKMMKQARQMQERLNKIMEDLEVEGSSGGGMVKVVMNGNKHVADLEIDPEVVDPDDVEMLQDMIVAAINQAAEKVDEELQSQMGGMLPPGMI